MRPDLNETGERHGDDAVLARLDAAQPYKPAATAPNSEQAAPDTQEVLASPILAPDEFFAYMGTHQYIYRPTREMWPAVSVNARVLPIMDGTNPLPANRWLDRHRAVEQTTWAPGEPEVIRDRHIILGGWTVKPGAAIFNMYRAPDVKPGDATKAGPWLKHLKTIYENDADHIVKWLAHRVQRPGDKINHSLVLGGAQGIGKDTVLEPVKTAIGAWNMAEVSPTQLLGRFNGFLKSTILRVSEARDLGDSDRYAFYNATKTLMAAPPDALRVDEKNAKEYMIPNVCGVIITTNHKVHGLFLEEDDRRHYVAWSESTKADFTDAYWNKIYGWYESGGLAHVAAYLRQFDLSGFLPKAPPPKTDAFWEIVDANRSIENNEFVDTIELLGNPAALTISKLRTLAAPGLADWLADRKNNRLIPGRLGDAGYTAVRGTQKDGRWKVGKNSVQVYAQKSLTKAKRQEAAEQLSRGVS